MGKFANRVGGALMGGVTGFLTGGPAGAAVGAAGALLQRPGGGLSPRGDQIMGALGNLGTAYGAYQGYRDAKNPGHESRTTREYGPGEAQLQAGFNSTNSPYVAYDGDRVASRNADQDAAAAAVRGTQGSYATDYAGAQGNAEGLARTGGLTPEDIQGFYNPYETGAVRAVQDDLAHQERIAQRGVAGRAEGAGAFGGSREAVARGVTSGEFARTGAATAAQMRSQGYQMAGNLAAQRAGYRLQGNQQLQGLIESRRRARETEIGALGVSGAGQQAHEQAKADGAYANYMNEQDYRKWQAEMQLRGGAIGAGYAGESTYGPRRNPIEGAIIGGNRIGNLLGAIGGRPAPPRGPEIPQGSPEGPVRLPSRSIFYGGRQ